MKQQKTASRLLQLPKLWNDFRHTFPPPSQSVMLLLRMFSSTFQVDCLNRELRCWELSPSPHVSIVPAATVATPCADFVRWPATNLSLKETPHKALDSFKECTQKKNALKIWENFYWIHTWHPWASSQGFHIQWYKYTKRDTSRWVTMRFFSIDKASWILVLLKVDQILHQLHQCTHFLFAWCYFGIFWDSLVSTQLDFQLDLCETPNPTPTTEGCRFASISSRSALISQWYVRICQ